MESSRFSMITNNNIRDNSKYGLYLRAASHRNTIKNNNFIDNENHAYFDGSIFNKWSRNHWSGSLWTIVKPIKGKLDLYNIPWVDFDLMPALREHEI